MNHCKIVEDLLPLYLDNLTSEETSEYIQQHMKTCIICAKNYKRMHMQINQKQELPAPDYKKSLKKSIFKIVIPYICLSVLLILLGFGITRYIYWEIGWLGEVEKFVSPDGESWFKVIDNSDAGFFNRGGAYIEMPVGSRNYRGNKNFVDLEVYWAPNSEYYFTVWEFKDHTDAYYWGYESELRYDENGNAAYSYWDRLYPQEENFMEILEELCHDTAELEEGWTDIKFSFSKWSEDSNEMCFSFETNNGQSGFLWYSIKMNTIVDVLK